MIKTIDLSSGTRKIDFDPDEKSPYFYTSNEYVWIKNLSADTVYVSLSEDCGNGVDGTAAIAPYDAYMLILDSRNVFYATGSGSIEVHTSDISTCPFKTSQKGGDISAEGGVVQFGGLQGGVPFSEITVKGENPPITGQELTVTACGKNMFPFPYKHGNKTENGITFTMLDDGGLSIKGVSTADTWYTIGNYDNLPDVTYTLSNSGDKPDGLTVYLNFKDANEVTLGQAICNAVYNPNGLTFVFPQNMHHIQARISLSANTTYDCVVYPQLEIGSTATAYEPYSGADYIITPDSNPYTVPTEIYQQDGVNTVYITGEGEPTLSVKGVKTNAAVKRIWDKLNELTTAVIVSNTGFNI